MGTDRAGVDSGATGGARGRETAAERWGGTRIQGEWVDETLGVEGFSLPVDPKCLLSEVWTGEHDPVEVSAGIIGTTRVCRWCGLSVNQTCASDSDHVWESIGDLRGVPYEQCSRCRQVRRG